MFMVLVHTTSFIVHFDNNTVMDEVLGIAGLNIFAADY